jgi:hypothetical protein
MSNMALDNKLWAAQFSAPSAFHAARPFRRRVPAAAGRSRETLVCDRTPA